MLTQVAKKATEASSEKKWEFLFLRLETEIKIFSSER